MSLFKHLGRTCALAALAGLSLLAQAPARASDVGVSVSIGQPGFYGRVDIGDRRPQLVYPEPVVIESSPVAVYRRPIYMRVPPGHYKRWSYYCGRYSACGQPVYFVNEPVVINRGPAYYGHDWRERARDRHERWHDRREDRHERWHDRHDGHGHGHGRGHGRHDH